MFNLPIYRKKTWSSLDCGMIFTAWLRKLLFVAIQKGLFNSSHLLFCSILLERDFLLTFKGKDSIQIFVERMRKSYSIWNEPQFCYLKY